MEIAFYTLILAYISLGVFFIYKGFKTGESTVKQIGMYSVLLGVGILAGVMIYTHTIETVTRRALMVY